MGHKTHQYRPIRHARLLRDLHGHAVDHTEHNGRHRRPDRRRIPWNLLAGSRGDPYRADDTCHERFRGRWLDSRPARDPDYREEEREQYLRTTRIRKKERRLANRRKTRQAKARIRDAMIHPTV